MAEPDHSDPSAQRGWRQTVQGWGSIVCISTADFDTSTWTNKQHIMSRLAAEVPVLYVESLGLRRPRLARRDIYRMAQRLRTPVIPKPASHTLHSGVRPIVIAPVIIPLHQPRAWRRVNRLLLDRAVAAKLDQLPRPRLLWSYNPVVIDELTLDRYDGIVYHCVDDLATMPRVSPQAIAETEERLVRLASCVFASSQSIYTRLSAVDGASVHLVHNVADADHFATAQNDAPLPPDLSTIPAPRAIFIGSLSDYKLDWVLLAEVVRARPDWSFVLIGPHGGEEAMSGLKALEGCENVFVLGSRTYEQLPSYLRGADAALIPYSLTPHTASVFPLKTWEYLAAGVHVVTTRLPALRAVSPPVDFACDASAFAAALDDGHTRTPEERLAAARRWTWESLLDRMFETIPTPKSTRRQPRP